MSALTIWLTAATLYLLFWLWYVGLTGKLSQAEVETFMRRFKAAGLPDHQQANIRQFLEGDDGKEWFMVNALELKKPKAESVELLGRYTRVFVPGILKRAGHVLVTCRVLAKNIENHNCDQADNWSSVALVRYRSRRDGAEMLINTFGSEHHAYKLAALEKTFAFPVSPIISVGSPRVTVALILALVAALCHIALVYGSSMIK